MKHIDPDVIIYNNELQNVFIAFTQNERYKSSLSEEEKANAVMSYDLLKSINTFRAYPCKKQLLDTFPELSNQELHINILWGHFKGLTSEELSDLAIDAIQELTIKF